MIPYAQPHIDKADRKAVDCVLRGTTLTQGHFVKEFEDAICEYTGAKYALTFNSGTSALHAAYLAIGVERVRIMMNPVTFVATANMAQLAGATVVFSDDAPDESVRSEKFSQPWVSMHYAGRYAGPGIVEDACHALGSDSPYGKVGNCGGGTKITVFSTHAIKNITTGEGGICTTNDEKLYDKMRMLRSHGRNAEQMWSMGYNYRMTDIQAALGLSQLNKIDKFRECKWEIWRGYEDGLPKELLSERMERLPMGPNTHWHLYVIEADNRDKLRKHLTGKGIGTQVHYRPVHLQPYWKGKVGTCPKSERFARRCLSLPLWVGLTRKQQEYIIESVKQFYGG